jgi:broad specificity phosphatase PhoE
MTTLIYETHATSLDNEAGLASGWYDVDLSATGEMQAREMGDRYRGVTIAAVYGSDLKRARRTADIAFGSRPLPVHADPRLRECDYGDLTRAPTSTIDKVRLECIATPFPGGESYEQAVARVRDWLAHAERRHADETIVVIGHRATFYAFEHLLRDLPLRDVMTAPWQWQPGFRYEV